MEEMGRGFAQRLRVLMKADAAVVRWSDEPNQRFLMLASDCLPGTLHETEVSLEAGSCDCGSISAEAGSRVIPIRSTASQPRPCEREGYQSVLSVPVRLKHRLLGELNLFFRSARELTAEESDLLDALASHLASGLEGLRAAALERENAVAAERGLLARELHDSIAQSLSFLKIQAQLMRTSLRRGHADKVQGVLDELDAGLLESIHDVRELLVHFRTRTNSDDLEPALRVTLRKFQHQTGLAAHLDVQGQGLPLPPDVQVQVLHVVQEALSNVRKHAHASQVWLDVAKGVRWRIEVRDDGSGFDAGADPGESHVGLKIMRERAERVGASVTVASSKGTGTTVTLELPEHPVARNDAPEPGVPGTPPPIRPESLSHA
jgi:two-component system, NarL family, nitrate/nitrite sensor histidine kinase NarX